MALSGYIKARDRPCTGKKKDRTWGKTGEKTGQNRKEKNKKRQKPNPGGGTTELGETKGKEKEQTFVPLVSSQRNKEVNEPEQRKNAEKK